LEKVEELKKLEFKFLDAEKMILVHGYQAEKHKIVTDDGYILTLFRIPGKAQKKVDPLKKIGPPVLFWHGLFCSAESFMINGPKNSPAFIAVERGYDVWLGNSRGNSYSRDHIKLDPNGKEFWDFSW